MDLSEGYNGIIFLVAVTLFFMAAERLVAWRRTAADPARWIRNASMSFYSVILLGLLPFLSGLAIALFAQDRDIGFLNAAGAPLWIGLALSVIAADATAFLQHRALHKWSFLWRLHRAHHTDCMVDVTTGLRFHPFETLFRVATEGLVILALGLPPEGLALAFVVFVIVNSLTHANVAMPMALERMASGVFITPRAHRLHHAMAEDFRNSNFGTLFSFWDRLSRTWIGVNALPDDVRFGIDGPEAPEADTFGNLALDPFRRSTRPGG